MNQQNQSPARLNKTAIACIAAGGLVGGLSHLMLYPDAPAITVAAAGTLHAVTGYYAIQAYRIFRHRQMSTPHQNQAPAVIVRPSFCRKPEVAG